MAYPFQETDAPADVAASDAPPEPIKKRYSLKGYSFLDAASRAQHPIVSALVANALAGPQAYKLLDALNQREEARKRTLASASEKRFEVGRQLALKMGDIAPLEPDDPLRPQFERAFGTMGAAPPPEGYEKKPPGNWLRKPPPIKPPPHRPVAGEGGIFDVSPGEGGGLEARPIPVLPPVGGSPGSEGPKKPSTGLIEPGNIDLLHRPVVRNPDGTISSVRSMSFEENGREILVPTVVGNRVVSDEEAIAEYHRTGKHLGIFDSSESADAYATQLHNDYASGRYGKQYAAPEGAPGAITKPIPIPSPTGRERAAPIPSPTGRERVEPIPLAPSHEPTGAGMFLKPKPPKAAGPGKPKMVQNEAGFFEPIDPTTGNSLLTGKPVRGKGPANLAGIQAQIDSAGLALENMNTSYQRGAKANLGSRTAGAMGQGVSEKLPSLRGIVQSFVPSGEDATIHEQNRGVVAGMLVRPLFGSARGQYLAEKIEKAIPHFTDSSRVAGNFYQQAKAFMASARRMPWDTSPKEAQRQYEAAAAEFLTAISTEGAPGGTPGGSAAGASRIDLLTAQAHKRALELQRQKHGGQ